jgi:hypothetical protein
MTGALPHSTFFFSSFCTQLLVVAVCGALGSAVI